MIEIKNVAKTYPSGDTEIIPVGNVNLEFSNSGMTALMGPSGSGKSTLLNLLGALDLPTSGQIWIDGNEISGLSADDRSRLRNQLCGFIFQNFNLVPILTVLENVLLPAQLGRKAISAQLNQHALDLLESVELSRFAHQKVNKLSGGQMQRVAIARSLMNKPKVVLADEPTANLDHRTAEVVLRLMKQTCESNGATIIIATHDDAVLKFCERVIYMTDGKITSDKKQQVS